MGDAEGKDRDDPPDTPKYAERWLLDSVGAAGLHSTVLKIAHHGSETSSTLPFIAAVSPKLNKPAGRDLVALRVDVTSDSGKRASWELLDYYDEARGISAMMRTTGYSLSITGLMQADGRITARGVQTPDEAVPFDAYVSELKRRGVEIREL